MVKSLLYSGDCLKEMARIPDGTVDMVLADLPYGVLHKKNTWDRVIPFGPLWKELERVTKPNAAIVLFAQGMFTAELMVSNRKLWRYNLVWDKMRVTAFLNAGRMPMRCHEDICVFYRKLPTYNPQYTDGPRNHSRGTGKHKDTNHCYGTYNGRAYESVQRVAVRTPEGKKLPRSIVAIKKEHESKVFHPTQKPVALLRWLIRTYSNKGETVLDCTMGSGSTGVAALLESRNFIGIELDEKYFEIARQRIGLVEAEPTIDFDDNI